MAMFIAGPMASMGRPEMAAEPDENVKATGKLLADSILIAEFPNTPYMWIHSTLYVCVRNGCLITCHGYFVVIEDIP